MAASIGGGGGSRISGPASLTAELDGDNPVTALMDAIGETLGMAPSPESTRPAPARQPQWQIQAGA